MKESEIERKVCDHAEELGFLQRKFVSPGHVGVPDRIFWGHNLHFLIEFKKPGGILSLPQRREIKRLLDAGVFVYVIDTIEKGKELLDKLAGGESVRPFSIT